MSNRRNICSAFLIGKPPDPNLEGEQYRAGRVKCVSTAKKKNMVLFIL
ncbi:hypothetical protein MNBD_NITROSPINAE01-1101 [hydrothermal vent metagenome]|uniref:Uncharacterized protein n=1 Tax=hydrothermal vent metagenome TaxID=652676 RepID=A0A3B1C800_9ZZZZ